MIAGARRIGVDSNIKTMLGANPDNHSLLGTPSLNRSKKQYDESNSEQPAEDDYTPDKVGEDPDYDGGEGNDYTPDMVSGNGVDSGRPDENAEFVWRLSYNYVSGYDPEHKFHITGIDNQNRIRIIQHPVEDGTVRMDNRVVDPERVTVKGWVRVDDVDSINNMLDFAKGSSAIINTFTIYGGMGKYEKFHLIDYTKRASTEKIDVYDYNLSMQEVLMGKSQTNNVKNPSYASTSDKGGNGGVKK